MGDTGFNQRRRALLDAAVEVGLTQYDNELGLTRRTHSASKYTGGVVAQSSLELAVGLLEQGRKHDIARKIIATTLRYQDRRADSWSRGNFFWMTHWDRIDDPNAVSFVMPNYVHLLMHHASVLGDKLVAGIREALELAGHALLTHRSQWSYSNIYLLNTANFFLLSHVLQQERWRDLGRWQWDEWMLYTSRARFGFAEFTSPAYTAVQIEALELLLSCPSDDRVRAQVETALAAYWQDFFAHYHPATGLFAGTKSRASKTDLRPGESSCDALRFLQIGGPPPVPKVNYVRYAISARPCPVTVEPLLLKPKQARRLTVRHQLWQITRQTWMRDGLAVSSQNGRAYGNDCVPLLILAGEGRHVGSLWARSLPPIAAVASVQQDGSVLTCFRFPTEPPPPFIEERDLTSKLRVAFGRLPWLAEDDKEAGVRLHVFGAKRESVSIDQDGGMLSLGGHRIALKWRTNQPALRATVQPSDEGDLAVEFVTDRPASGSVLLALALAAWPEGEKPVTISAVELSASACHAQIGGKTLRCDLPATPLPLWECHDQ